MVMFAELSGGEQRLVRVMQQINFGRIENIPIQGGLPRPGQDTRVVQKIRMGKDNDARDESSLSDFYLKAQVVDFFRQLAEIRDGTILSLEVQNGLPAHMEVEGSCDVEGCITDRVDGDDDDDGDDGDGGSDAHGDAADAHGSASDADDNPNPITPRMEKQIHYFASRMVGVAGIREDDLEDVEQDLRLHLFCALQQHDPDLASAETYASRVVERKVANMIRDLSRRRARIRDEVSIEALDDGTEDIPALSYTENVGLEHDVSDTLGDLGEWDREVAERLPHGTISEVADTLGVHRERICTAQKRIRSALRRKGLDKYI